MEITRTITINSGAR